MKQTTMTKAGRLATAAWAAVALLTTPAVAKEHHKSAGAYGVVRDFV